MKNRTLINAAKKILKDLLSQCTQSEQHMFRRMYSAHPEKMEDIDVVVDNMDTSKMDWAISQCERSIEKKIKQ